MSCRILARIYLTIPNRITSFFFVRCVTKREERWKRVGWRTEEP